jgi:hypothetical protein
MSETDNISVPQTAPAPFAWRRVLRLSGKVFLFLFLLVFLTTITGGFIVECLFHLVLGWAVFLWQTLPQVRLDLGMIASGLIALTLAVWGLQRFASWLTSQIPGFTRLWKTRWTLALTAVVLLLFASAIAGIGIGHQAAWLSRVKWTGYRNRGDLRNLMKGQQLRQMLAIQALEKDRKYPNQLASVFDGEDPSLQTILLPLDDNGTPESWIYLGAGLTVDAPSWVPILASPQPVGMKRKRTIIRNNGTGEQLSESAYQPLLEQWRTYKRSNPQPKTP